MKTLSELVKEKTGTINGLYLRTIFEIVLVCIEKYIDQRLLVESREVYKGPQQFGPSKITGKPEGTETECKLDSLGNMMLNVGKIEKPTPIPKFKLEELITYKSREAIHCPECNYVSDHNPSCSLYKPYIN